MLAYVFTHQPAGHADVATYENVLRLFHETLASTKPRGFLGSRTYRAGGWYADWYLLEDSAALDVLNEAAVTGGRATAHDAAARMAADGVGKLYSLASGEPDDAAGRETRFAKPAGMSYRDLYIVLERWTGTPGYALWKRMMVLGPGPEFCLVSREPVDLPAEMRPEAVLRTPI